MKTIEMPETRQQDQTAVAAVRGGDAERYRELVERYERRVYAVAWSRLGDAALAEEATQEAFIRAYRHLWLLSDGAKFSGWVGTIARRVAINFGLRHRRELDKRKRWALENVSESAPANPANEDDPAHSPETLRQTLAELPAAHRECLVLFYLEGKSGAEAAAALGISEAALRTRLHRARAALRERLEEKLESSLEKLRPAKTLVPAVMAGVLASSSTKAAATGGSILTALAKFAPFKWLFAVFIPLLLLLFPMMVLSSSLFFHRWRIDDEQRNYRDAKGFRATLYRDDRDVDYSWGFSIIAILILLLLFTLTGYFTIRFFSTKDLFFLLGVALLIGGGFAARQLQINWSWFRVMVLLVNYLAMSVVYMSIGLGWLRITALFPAIAISGLFTILANPTRVRVLRMDYNLFLRASQGILPPTNVPAQEKSANRLDRSALRAFARFLGRRELAENFRWGADGLTLYLPAVKKPSWAWSAIWPSFGKNSNITLRPDASVTAHCGKKDAASLEILRGYPLADLDPMEREVASAVTLAWQKFRAGNIDLAEQAIGQIPDEEIFLVPPTRTGASRWYQIIFGGIMAVCAIGLIALWIIPDNPLGVKSVSLSEAQVREFMSQVSVNPNLLIKAPDGMSFIQKAFTWDPAEPLMECLVLPGTNLFTPHGLQAMRDTVAGSEGFDAVLSRDEANRMSWPFGAPLPRRALAAGWISWNDLGIQPEDAGAFLHTNSVFRTYSPEHWDDFLTREQAWSWVKREKWDVMRMQLDGVTQLQLLRDVNSLDLVDRDKLIQQIASVQTLSAQPPGNPPIHDWKDVRGLFFTPCYPALQDTYYSLAALQILGGLDKIDKEQCVQGILRLHRGKGFFTSPVSGNYNEYHVDGSARDTIAAYESLRILGALDRVKDLDKWEFRPNRLDVAKNEVTWEDIEAWVCQQRLEKILQEHKENPSAPFGSLLAP